MNPLYEKSKDLILIRRTSDNKEFEEYPLNVQPQSALVTDPTNDVLCFSLCALRVGYANSASYSETGSFAYTASHAFKAITSSFAHTSSHAFWGITSSYAITASHAFWAITASHALDALSASYALSSSYTISSSYAVSASNAYTSSYAFEASHAVYSDSASKAESASYAYSASYAGSASYGTNFYAPRVTSSYVSASEAIVTNQFTASSALVMTRMLGTASYAIHALGADTSAYATNAGTADLALFALTASLATASFTASWAYTASYADSASLLYSQSVPNAVVFTNAESRSITSDTLLFDNETLQISSNASKPSLRIGLYGGLQLQNYDDLNNCWIADNVHFNGTKFVYDDSLYGEQIYFNVGETQFRNGDLASVGDNFTTMSQMKVSEQGWVAIGNAIDGTWRSTRGATMVVSSSGVTIYRGGLTASLVHGTSSWARSASMAVAAGSASLATTASYVTASYSVIANLFSDYITCSAGISVGGYNQGVTDTSAVQLGHNIKKTNKTDNSVQIGYSAGTFNPGTASSAVQIGWIAGNGSIEATNAVQIGAGAGFSSKNAYTAVQVGANAGSTSTTASAAVQVGYWAGQGSTDARDAVQIGASAGQSATNASRSVLVGAGAGFNASADSVMLGYKAGYNDSTPKRLHIANTDTKTLIYGEFDNNLVIINNALSASVVTANKGAKIGGMSEGIASANTVQIGTTDVGVPLPDASYKRNGAVQIGWGAGQSAITASNAVAIGIQAGTNTKLADNAVQIGSTVGANSITASNAVQIGVSAGQNATNASNAVHIGSSAGTNATSGSYTTFVGSGADTLNADLNVEKSIAIGYNAKVSGSNMAVIGGTGADAVSVGIGTNSPQATLHVVGNISASSVTASLFGTASHAVSASYALSASHALFSSLASSSISVRGLNMNSIAPMPNNQIGWGVAAGNAAVAIGSAYSNETASHATIKLNNKLYGAGFQGNIYVINDPDGDITNITTASFIAGNYVAAVAYSATSGYLYFINGNDGNHFGEASGSIVQVDPNDITSQTIIVQGLTGGALPPLVCDDTYLYSWTSGSLFQWDLTGTYITSSVIISASVALGGGHGGTISTDKQWLYFTTAGSTVIKAKANNIANYTASARVQCDFPTGPFDATITDDICYLNGYVYATQESSNGNVYKINATDLTSVAYPASYTSYGIFTDGTNLYECQHGGEIWVYLNGDVDSGPIRFSIGHSYPNEIWVTDGGRIVYSIYNLSSNNSSLFAYYFPITQLGINKAPLQALDVAGVINADIRLQSPAISCSGVITTYSETVAGSLTLGGSVSLSGSSIIAYPSGGGRTRIDSGSIRTNTLSSSAALLGKVTNTRFSQSFTIGVSMSYSQSLGMVPQDGMYKLTMASTIGFYEGITITMPPSWSFVHTDRLGAYLMPSTPPPYYSITPAGYDQGYAFSNEYVFQAISGSPIEYYYSSNGIDVSSAMGSGSFFTSVTLTEIMSGSITGSI